MPVPRALAHLIDAFDMNYLPTEGDGRSLLYLHSVLRTDPGIWEVFGKL